MFLCVRTSLHVVPRFVFILHPSSTLNLHLLSLFSVGLVIGAAAQKSHKRRVHIASPTSHSVTVTRLPEMGSTFASSTGTLPNSDKLHSLYAHTSHRTHSTSSTLSGPTVSPTSNHGSQPEGQSQIYKRRFDGRKAFKWKPTLDPQMVTKGGDDLHVGYRWWYLSPIRTSLNSIAPFSTASLNHLLCVLSKAPRKFISSSTHISFRRGLLEETTPIVMTSCFFQLAMNTRFMSKFIV